MPKPRKPCKPALRGSALVADSSAALDEALAEGAAFCINRLEDRGWQYRGKEPELQARGRAIDDMVEELRLAILSRFRAGR